jgi:Secretion system C-terminal sorting domain
MYRSHYRKIMNRNLLPSFFCITSLVFFHCGFCQQVINTTGNTIHDNNINIEYSIGEIAITTLSSGSNYATQGLLQPTTKLADPSCIIINDTINYFPNPTENILRVVARYDWIKAYRIYAADGKLLRIASFVNNQINMNNLPGGVYFIKLYPGCNDKFRILKVIKQ